MAKKNKDSNKKWGEGSSVGNHKQTKNTSKGSNGEKSQKKKNNKPSPAKGSEGGSDLGGGGGEMDWIGSLVATT